MTVAEADDVVAELEANRHFHFALLTSPEHPRRVVARVEPEHDVAERHHRALAVG